MARIQQMPAHLAEVIAAGEVIERPASALKELLENSLDAGASEIEVRALKGGKTLLEVSDNGGGIHPDDLVLAVARHATSKLLSNEDLQRIRTFGFRGEALASMAAVAKLTLESRQADAAAGAAIKVDPGVGVSGPFPLGRRVGTRVLLQDLFENLPARQKFLRGDQTEEQRLRDVLKIFSVAHPEVGFRFVSGDRERLNLAPATLDQRLAKLFPEIDWIDVAGEGARFRLTGVLSHPHQHRAKGDDLYVFVNRRYVKDPLLRKAVQSGFEGVIPPGQWPLGAAFVDVLPADIDVNVHPAKTEVRFLNPGGLFAEIRGCIQAALREQRRPPGTTLAASAANAGRHAAMPRPVMAPVGAPPSYNAPINRQAQLQVADSNHPYAPAAAQPGFASMPGLDLAPLGSLGDRYLLFRENDALILVDQHAAHERVRYDRILAALGGDKQPTQELLTPEIFSAEPAELEGFRLGGEWLAKVGFVVEAFGPETLRLRSVPRWFRGDPRPALRDSLKEISAYRTPAAIERETRAIAASLACKGAVLSGRKLPLEEQRALLQQLLATPGAETCPHGRPIYRRMTQAELDRWFGR